MALPLLELPEQAPAEDIDEEILEIFVEEVDEVLEEMKNSYEIWRESPSDTESLQTLRRAFHTLKGSGRLVGATVLGELGWAFENMLNKILEGIMPRNSHVLRLLDQVAEMVPPMIQQFQAGETQPPYATLLLMSQAIHLTKTKGAELGEFVGAPTAQVDGELDDELLVADSVKVEVMDAAEVALDAVEPTQEAVEEICAVAEIKQPIEAVELEMPVVEKAQATPAAVVTERSTNKFIDDESDEKYAAVLQDIFQTEAKGHLKELKEFLVKCHKSLPCQVTEPIIRVLHTLNGSSRSIGFNDLAELAARMENFSRIAFERRLLLKKEIIALFVESGRTLEHTLKNQGHTPEEQKQKKLLSTWDRLLAALPKEERSLEARETESEMEPKKTMPTDFPTPPDNLKIAPADSFKTAPAPAAPIPVSVAEEGGEEAVDEFMEIFLEEAEEILETCQSLLGRWQASPNSMPLLKELQRELHTLKGGSRMVGISVMGDLSHHLESVLTKIVEGNAQSNPALQGIVQESVDELASMLEAVRSGESLTPNPELLAKVDSTLSGGATMLPTPLPVTKKASATDEIAAATESETVAHPAEPEKAVISNEKAADDAGAESDERVRVKAQLIDKLTNLAGEMAINRAHLEQQQGSAKLNLQEMDQTVMRLRDQLRRLEIETEAQIISHFGQVTSTGPDDEEFDPLEMDRFSVLQQLSRSLMETVTDLQNIQESMASLYRHTDSLLIQQSRVGAELQDGIMRTRMVPFAQISPRLQRIARLTSRELHKQVNFSVNDDSIEFERTVLNRIVAPLEHMLRNAIGHGIENGDVRAKVGKLPVAEVRIDLSQEGAELILKLSDDGAGINTDAIRKKAIERGMIKPDEIISEEELMQFILQPAFSTAKTITQVSGRGVGMDIASNEIKQLGGALQIHSVRGKGTTFEVRLPLSLTISQSLLIHLGEETMAVPLHNVDGVVRIPRQDLQTEQGDAKNYTFMGKSYRIAYLADMLGFPHASVDTSLLPLMLVSVSEQRIALVIDAIEGSKEVVVKSVGPQLSGIRWIAGATILGDGRVVIILDVLTLLRSHSAMHKMHSMAAAQEGKELKPVVKTIMVVDDSITVRKVTARLLKRQGMEVMTAKDGVDAIAQLQENIPDLMLLDVEMPRMDGFELATQMRNSDALKHIPIIMITSRTGSKHRERAAKIGINKHLGKPFNEPELLENINALLGEHPPKSINKAEVAHE